MIEEQRDIAEREIERLVHSWSELEVEQQALKRKILLYHDEKHIPRGVEEILNNWSSQSQAQVFNAISTVAYKKRVIDYYNEFKKQLESRDDIQLNIAMTFSFGGDEDDEPVDP